jgi:hypothetical protein
MDIWAMLFRCLFLLPRGPGGVFGADCATGAMDWAEEGGTYAKSICTFSKMGFCKSGLRAPKSCSYVGGGGRVA